MFHENAAEFGLPFDHPPTVRRVSVEVAPGQSVSALQWGVGEPEIVLIHGGAQNAHTWDTVALALDTPLLAIDLPGHGHSDHRADRAYWPMENGAALEVAVRALAPHARLIVGMSLGGLSSVALAARAPDLVARLLLVDVTPGVDGEKASAIVAFVAGPQSFASFDELLARTMEHNPTRSESSLRRGILHNAKTGPDGRWVWRYDRFEFQDDPAAAEQARVPHFGALWDELGAVTAPLMLVRGSLSPVVSDDDVAELVKRQPTARVVVVDGAGHSIQGDRPLELAAIIREFATGTS
jgi:pimeloyl-ACP methyl ester carboxylesterase